MNPGYRPPVEVAADPAYESVASILVPMWPSSSMRNVVRHRESGTYWTCMYDVGDDDDDSGRKTSWKRCEPREVVIKKTEWEIVPDSGLPETSNESR